MKVTSGKYEVVYSSWAPSYKMNDVILTLSEEPEITVKVSVKRDDTLDKADVLLDFPKEKLLLVSVINPHLLSHIGSPEPAEIGTLQGKKLLFSFRVDMFGDYRSFAVTYAFMLG